QEYRETGGGPGCRRIASRERRRLMTDQPHLERRFGTVQATALNMTNMIGVGPFITIPALMSAISPGGPQAMIGWLAALLLAMMDGMVWSELAAAMPGS